MLHRSSLMEIVSHLNYSFYDELQKKRVGQLNQAINEGLVQLEKGQGVKADQAYNRLKKKLGIKTKK